MQSETKAKITEYIVELVFYFLPLILTGVFFVIADSPYYLNFEKREFEATLSSAWIGYSFGAAFFLIALPRNKYLERIESKGLLIRYSLTIMTPAITGTLHMLSIVVSNNSHATLFLKNVSAYLFYSTVLYTIYSLVILLRILKLSAIRIH